MSFGLKGMTRHWGPGVVLVAGSFTVASNAIVTTGAGAVRPSRPGFNVVRTAAGVYTVQLTQAFQSVLDATVKVGPATGFGNTNYPTSEPNGVMITQDFFTAAAGKLVPDTTNKNLVILCYTTIGEGTIGELTANYRCAFEIALCESAVNK